MPDSSECLLKHSDSKTSPVVKEIFLRNTDEGEYNHAKYYRSIPVTKTFGGFKAPGFYCENVSGVKEMKNIDLMLGSSTYHTGTSSVLGSKLFMGTPKQRLKLDAATAVNAFQRKLYPYHTLLGQIRRRSVSEPSLTAAEVQEEGAVLRDLYREGTFLESQYFGSQKSAPLKKSGVEGSVYIRNAGKVYKSKIEAENLCMEDNCAFGATNRGKCRKIPQLGNFIPKGNDYAAWFGTNTLKSGNHQEGGDFEIAIFLSGVKNISEGEQPQTQDVQQPPEAKRIGGGIIRKAKKKKPNARKGEKPKLNPYDTDTSSRFYRKVDKFSDVPSDLSSRGSESDYVLSESEKISKRGGAKHGDGDNPDSRQMKGTEVSYKSNPSERKTSDSELWARFKSAFRSYASTDRHSGGVIPKKISTEWLTDACVVGEIMTEREASEAFRHAAGAKITMNTKEYKEFLVKLSLRLKLPCYEIYRRMCGMHKEDKTLP